MHDVVERARRLADEVLAPSAQLVDVADRVPAAGLRALAEAGLLGIAGPRRAGGEPLDAPTFRRVAATVAGGCGATAFCWVQHHGVVRLLAAAEGHPLADELLVDLVAGRALAGTAFAHVRRGGPPAITATPTEGGWRLDGVAPWVTSWGLADVFSVAAETADGRLVWSLVEGPPAGGGEARPDLVATPLALPVLGATGTVALRVDGLAVPDERVVLVEGAERWRRHDRARSAPGAPAVLGVAERAVRLLGELGDPAATSAAAALADELDAAWRRDDDVVARCAGAAAAIDDAGDDERVAIDDEVEAAVRAGAAHRAACLDLGARSTSALVAGCGGRAMDLAHPAQRLAREALFLVIQAQTADGRAATLRRRSGGAP